MSTVSLLKYQAIGNDFLIALDPALLAPSGTVDEERVAFLCDRRRGIGADGLILVHPPRAGGAVAMELRNADGGRAETSGNGLRCLALALVDAGVVSSRRFVIETEGREVAAAVSPRRSGAEAEVSVTMGPARLGESQPSPLDGFTARSVDVGNPHLVLLGESLAGIDVAAFGPGLEVSVPGGQNVEVVARTAPDTLGLVVWERGAGLTPACGSGSVAAAAVARAAGLVGDRVVVENPGGRLVVELTGEGSSPEAALEGPACRVGRVEVELEPAVAPEGVVL